MQFFLEEYSLDFYILLLLLLFEYRKIETFCNEENTLSQYTAESTPESSPVKLVKSLPGEERLDFYLPDNIA